MHEFDFHLTVELLMNNTDRNKRANSRQPTGKLHPIKAFHHHGMEKGQENGQCPCFYA